jgi:hypothetical protein
LIRGCLINAETSNLLAKGSSRLAEGHFFLKSVSFRRKLITNRRKVFSPGKNNFHFTGQFFKVVLQLPGAQESPFTRQARADVIFNR